VRSGVRHPREQWECRMGFRRARANTSRGLRGDRVRQNRWSKREWSKREVLRGRRQNVTV